MYASKIIGLFSYLKRVFLWNINYNKIIIHPIQVPVVLTNIVGLSYNNFEWYDYYKVFK